MGYFLSLKFVEIAFFTSSYELASASIISSHVITESSIIFAKYLPFLQQYVVACIMYILCIYYAYVLCICM